MGGLIVHHLLNKNGDVVDRVKNIERVSQSLVDEENIENYSHVKIIKKIFLFKFNAEENNHENFQKKHLTE